MSIITLSFVSTIILPLRRRTHPFFVFFFKKGFTPPKQVFFKFEITMKGGLLNLNAIDVSVAMHNSVRL